MPGSPQPELLAAVEAALPGRALDVSRRVLRERGDMSSPPALFALADALGSGPPEPGADWWPVAFGAGFVARSRRVQAEK